MPYTSARFMHRRPNIAAAFALVFASLVCCFGADLQPPTVTQVLPSPGTTNRSLATAEVFFDENVQGVAASDLLVNGLPAQDIEFFGAAHYLFHFDSPAPGLVQFTWAAAHGIRDAASNAFAGGSWVVTLDPSFGISKIVISEFMAANTRTTNDVDGDTSDWIELFNLGDVPVDLNGWFLTDTTNNLTKWRLPNYVFSANSYLLVWASNKDRTNVAAQLHANFKLDAGGEYLALIGPETNVVSEFAPTYPNQPDDVSYGRDPVDPTLIGFYTTPTPGKRNTTGGAGFFAPDVVFSTSSGTFVNPFTLTLSLKSPASNAVIRYVIGTNVPSTTSAIFTGPLTITNTMQVRARAFAPGLFPGDVHSEQYIRLHQNVLSFKSDLPIVVLHNNGGGAVPASADQFVMVQTFQPTNGFSSLTNIPNDRARGIFHRRGASTLDFPKSNFFLETRDEFDDDKDESFLGLPQDSDWVLYAPNIYDPPMIHNPVGYEISRQMGHYASRTRFVVVFLKDQSADGRSVNIDDYSGIYVLEEKVKVGADRVDIAELDAGDNVAPAITGGYLFSIDAASRNSPGETQFVAGSQSMNYVNPHFAEMITPQRTAQRNYLKGYFDAFGAALDGPNWTNPVTGYLPYIDADSWIDYHVTGVITRNIDATRYSTYLYKPRNGKIAFGPVWDLDRSQGGTDGRDFGPRVWNCGTSVNYFNYSWWGRILEEPNFWQRWIDRYQDLRRGTLTVSNVFRIVDTNANLVRLEQPRDAARWNTTFRTGLITNCNFTYNFGTGSFQGEINWMKTWWSNRLDFLDDQLLSPPTFNRSAGSVTNRTVLTLAGPAGATIYYTLNGTDPRGLHGVIASNALTYSGPITISNNVRVVARCRDLTHRNLTGGLNPPISSPWSGPVAATYYTQLPPLIMTEVMYHPEKPAAPDKTDADEFEFIELRNTAATPLNLVGFRFTNGIDFTFTATNPVTIISPGAFLVLVKNRTAFSSRYLSVTNIAGEYSGNLENGGERIYLEGPLGEPVAELRYDDLWYSETDGNGPSLVLVNDAVRPTDYSTSLVWRASSRLGGSPGQGDGLPRLNVRHHGASVVLSWPAAVGSSVLVSATNFSPPVLWQPFTGAATNGAGEMSVTSSATGDRRFFRLQNAGP
jgi:hypothetical protein